LKFKAIRRHLGMRTAGRASHKNMQNLFFE